MSSVKNCSSEDGSSIYGKETQKAIVILVCQRMLKYVPYLLLASFTLAN